MNGIRETVQNLVFKKATADDLLEELEYVKNPKQVPDMLQVHKAIRTMESCFGIDFLSSDVDPYNKTCGHKVNQIVDSDTCNLRLQNYNEKENCEWVECLICKKWFHEKCSNK